MLSSLKMIVFTRNYYRKYLLIIAIFCTFADENCVKHRHGNFIKSTLRCLWAFKKISDDDQKI